MARINPRKLPRPPEVTETREFADPALLEPMALTFRSRPDFGEALAIQSLAGNFIREHIGTPEKPVVPLAYDSRPVAVTPELCAAIAMIATLDVPVPGDGYGFDEWAILSVALPTVFAEIYQWAQELMERASSGIARNAAGKPELPNDSAASEDSSCEPPPNMEPPTIPT